MLMGGAARGRALVHACTRSVASLQVTGTRACTHTHTHTRTHTRTRTRTCAHTCTRTCAHTPHARCRPELALCLLAEVAYEHDEDFRPHMPLLLHACICCLDQEGEADAEHGGSGCTVSAHAQQLLMHLLYSVSARYIEAATDAGQAAECPQVGGSGGCGQPHDQMNAWQLLPMRLRHSESARYVEAATDAELAAGGWAEMFSRAASHVVRCWVRHMARRMCVSCSCACCAVTPPSLHTLLAWS